MPRVRRWRDLFPGLLALVALVALVGGVLGFARVGALRGDTLRLVVLAGSARDVLAGSEVWIAGQKVGAVRDVAFRPAGTDTAFRLAIGIDVLTTARTQLRRDTRAQIRTGGSLLGAPVVTLSGGSAAQPLLEDGDTLYALRQLDQQSVTGSFAAAGEHVDPLRRNVARILVHLRDADGAIGASARGQGLAGAGEIGARVGQLASRFRGGPVGRLLGANDPVRRRVAVATARADSIRRLLTEPAGTVGRFRRDSTLATQITAVRDEVAQLRALLDEPRGSAGRALHDGALARELASLEAELRALAADVRDRPFRYVVF
jgi:phospholipid/cholesterol/gamma-HCH transport system substrate-binding protein